MPAAASQCHWPKGSLVSGGGHTEEAHYPFSCKPTSLIPLLGCQEKGRTPCFFMQDVQDTALLSPQGMETSSPLGKTSICFQPTAHRASPSCTHHSACSWGCLVCSSGTEKLSALHELDLCILGLVCPVLGEHLKHEGFLELLSTGMKLPRDQGNCC